MNNPLRRQARICLLVALGKLLLALAAFPFIWDADGNGRFVFFFATVVGACGFVLMGVVGMIVWKMAGWADRQLEAFQRGNALVHWTYTPEEWLRFAKVQYGGPARIPMGLVWVPLSFLAALLGISAFSKEQGDGSLLVVVSLSVLACPLLIFFLMRFRRWSDANRARQIGETFIGPSGVYFNGYYHSWASGVVWLEGVEFQEGEQSALAFTFGTTEGSGYTVAVLVPSGREEEAKALARTLS